MALGLGEGGEQNAPLGRAVIGGLLCATVATLMFVPSLYALLSGAHASKAAAQNKDRGLTMSEETRRKQ
jgi:Cu/Ag efflux pump CusA